MGYVKGSRKPGGADCRQCGKRMPPVTVRLAGDKVTTWVGYAGNQYFCSLKCGLVFACRAVKAGVKLDGE